jgi:3-carboxy-cis,cis-muconate cycloisomerase
VTSRIVDALVTTDALSEVFSDGAVVRALLDVEAALARAEASAGVIPTEAAEAIARAASGDDFDAAAVASESRSSGTIAVPLVAALRARVRSIDDGAARFVHLGTTSQDIVDTAFVLLVDRACVVMAADHRQLAATLRALSDRHREDVMLGRTLLQPATPITFGLKVAGWFAAVERGWARVDTRRHEAVVLQFGGASGTLASLGDKGLTVADTLARELGLRCPPAPWHAWPDNLAALVAACGIYAGVLAKIAGDIALLMQGEVGEVNEPGGGSSTMPHKQNPAGCARVLAAASRLPGLNATMMASLVQEHERAVGAWHVEWPTIVDALQSTGAALEAMAKLGSGLISDSARMRANLEATRGSIFAERVMVQTAGTLPRERAEALVKDALGKMRASGSTFGEIVRATPELAGALGEDELRTLDDPRSCLGATETFRQRLLNRS